MAVFPAMLSLSSCLPTSHCLSIAISTSLPFCWPESGQQASSCLQGKELTYRLRRRWWRQHHTRGLSDQGNLVLLSGYNASSPPSPSRFTRSSPPLLCGHSWAAEAGPGSTTEVGASSPCHLEPRGDPPLGRSLVGQWRRESVPRVLPLESLLRAPHRLPIPSVGLMFLRISMICPSPFFYPSPSLDPELFVFFSGTNT